MKRRYHEKDLRRGRWSKSGLVYAVTKNVLDRRSNPLIPNPMDPHSSKAAPIVVSVLRWLHQREWLDCVAYTVMPDHAHIVFGLGSEKTLRQVMHSFSRNSSRQIHQAVGGEGRLWQKGYYDDRVEDEEEFENQVRYVLYNPVKAGHVRDPDDWPFSGYLPEW